MDIRIEINNKTLNTLAGRPNGLKYYQDYMKDAIETNITNPSEKFKIVFPSYIKNVTGSCLLGMFEAVYRMIGLQGIQNRFSFGNDQGKYMPRLVAEIRRSGRYI